MFDNGWDRATQLVVVEVSVDLTKHTFCYQHTNTNRETTNKIIVIVTDKLVSAVNCPIKFEIVPFS